VENLSGKLMFAHEAGLHTNDYQVTILRLLTKYACTSHVNTKKAGRH